MHAQFAIGSGNPSVGLIRRLARLGLATLPFWLFLTISVRAPVEGSLRLWLGTAFLGLACLLALISRQGWDELGGPALIMLYVIALSWLLLASAGLRDDWAIYLAQAVLLVVPLGFFAFQCLRDSGAPALRRARLLAARLAARTDWPADLLACRLLPEVKALREALHVDASPALALLNTPKPHLRVAALAALEFRQSWRPGQPTAVLTLARHASEPEVRAAAVNALANLDDRLTLEALAELLGDPAPLVRQTATEALLWNTEDHWPWIRFAVRTALANPACEGDGALRLGGNRLTPEAVDDLTAWAAEKGVLAVRAALTLGVHYAQVLAAGAAPELLAELRRQLSDPHTPPMLRLELARLLQQHHELDESSLRRLLDPSTPAPVRLIAVEALLAQQNNCPHALAALRELARLPNREMALVTADVIQRRLGVDFGLPRGQPTPPVQSRLAAEVARRLLLWSSQYDPSENEPAAGQAT
jgi:hypothetical protein